MVSKDNSNRRAEIYPAIILRAYPCRVSLRKVLDAVDDAPDLDLTMQPKESQYRFRTEYKCSCLASNVLLLYEQHITSVSCTVIIRRQPAQSSSPCRL